MALVTLGKMLVRQPLPAYLITVMASFLMTLFLVTYFTTIYKTVKGPEEEEFIILREIPTVLGRMVVFGAILLTLKDLRFFFLLPLIFSILLLSIFVRKRKALAD